MDIHIHHKIHPLRPLCPRWKESPRRNTGLGLALGRNPPLTLVLDGNFDNGWVILSWTHSIRLYYSIILYYIILYVSILYIIVYNIFILYRQ